MTSIIKYWSFGDCSSYAIAALVHFGRAFLQALSNFCSSGVHISCSFTVDHEQHGELFAMLFAIIHKCFHHFPGAAPFGLNKVHESKSCMVVVWIDIDYFLIPFE